MRPENKQAKHDLNPSRLVKQTRSDFPSLMRPNIREIDLDWLRQDWQNGDPKYRQFFQIEQKIIGDWLIDMAGTIFFARCRQKFRKRLRIIIEKSPEASQDFIENRLKRTIPGTRLELLYLMSQQQVKLSDDEYEESFDNMIEVRSTYDCNRSTEFTKHLQLKYDEYVANGLILRDLNKVRMLLEDAATEIKASILGQLAMHQQQVGFHPKVQQISHILLIAHEEVASQPELVAQLNFDVELNLSSKVRFSPNPEIKTHSQDVEIQDVQMMELPPQSHIPQNLDVKKLSALINSQIQRQEDGDDKQSITTGSTVSQENPNPVPLSNKEGFGKDPVPKSPKGLDSTWESNPLESKRD